MEEIGYHCAYKVNIGLRMEEEKIAFTISQRGRATWDGWVTL